jgi:hypothetical protein
MEPFMDPETTVCSIPTQIKITDDPITIGKPIANTQILFIRQKECQWPG